MSGQYISNPPQRLSLNYFRSVAGNFGSLAKGCRFVVRINPIGDLLKRQAPIEFMEDLSYLCETAEMPGRGFQNIDMRYYGPSFKLPFQSVYEDINLTFLCRSESFEREFFDNWMELINPSNTFDFNYRDQYRADVDIFKISDYSDGSIDGAKATYSFSLLNAFPILVNPQPVTWADDQFLRLGVSFTYHWWTRKDLDKQSKGVGSLVL